MKFPLWARLQRLNSKSNNNKTKEKKVYLISGSKKIGGFIVTRKGLLYPSKIGNILEDTYQLCNYELEQGEFVKYKGDYIVGRISQMMELLN